MNYATTQGSREKLVRDLQRIVSDADDLLKGMASAMAEDFAVVRERIEEKLRDAKASLDEAQIGVTEKTCGAAHATRQYIRENPWKLLGVAAVAALVTAMLISRR